MTSQKALLAQPVLAVQRVCHPGRTGPVPRQPAERRSRDVFEFDGDRAGLLGKRPKRRQMVGKADDSPVSDLCGRRLRGGARERRRGSPAAAPPG